MQHAMPARPFIADGLWRCLCPSFQPALLARRLSIVAAPRPRRLPRCPLVRRPPRRLQQTATAEAPNDAPQYTNFGPSASARGGRTRSAPTAAETAYTSSNRAVSRSEEPNRSLPIKRVLEDVHGGSRRHIKGFLPKELQGMSTEAIYALLRTRARRGYSFWVDGIVTFLVKERKEQPNAKLYSAMILVNVNPQAGSAGFVKSILKEMNEEGISLDTGTCHDILKASLVFCLEDGANNGMHPGSSHPPRLSSSHVNP